MVSRLFAVLSVALFVLPLPPAMANGGPKGIAIAEAPELSSGVCFAANPDTAFDCARRKCAEADGVSASDCLRVTWCYPSGWSADVFLQNKDGFHWHEYLCGWDPRATIEAAAKVKCDTGLRDYLLECAVVRIWDNGGTQVSGE